jgi:hypothetical protein
MERHPLRINGRIPEKIEMGRIAIKIRAMLTLPMKSG